MFALGTSMRSIPIMLVGRVIFGLGGESLCVGQSTIIAQWFDGKELGAWPARSHNWRHVTPPWRPHSQPWRWAST